ncbi:hypothetical protein B0H17DRAFT_1217688 [Mycena rosella]|uniref:Uncharacterized protein n=1 Tax=Mycena rosella TaxID=1033263 RepID=A0AAD7FQ74_MYCRO|nr:hypothetical protein B0H17DRAFT_1217688 [Mycena rosella]
MADTLSQMKSSEGMGSIRQTGSLQLVNTNLNSLAVIATFLAAVQAQAISFSVDKNTTKVEIATNTLFFAGLFVDVLSGTIAIVGSVQLQRTYGLLKQRESSLAGLKTAVKTLSSSSNAKDALALVNHLHYLERVMFPLLQSPRLWNSLSQPLRQSADLVEQIIKDSEFEDHLRITFVYSLADYRRITNRLASSRFRTSLGFTASLIVPGLVIAGLCCFMAGALCFVLDSQPVQVWATSIGVLAGTLLLLLTVLGLNIDPRTIELPFNDV